MLKDGEDLGKEGIFHRLYFVGKCESLVKADRDLRPRPRMRGRRKGCCPSCLSIKTKGQKVASLYSFPGTTSHVTGQPQITSKAAEGDKCGANILKHSLSVLTLPVEYFFVSLTWQSRRARVLNNNAGCNRAYENLMIFKITCLLSHLCVSQELVHSLEIMKAEWRTIMEK